MLENYYFIETFKIRMNFIEIIENIEQDDTGNADPITVKLISGGRL